MPADPQLDLPAYIEQRFPGIRLGETTFYDWPFALRFEIGAENIAQRVVAIYEEVFAAADSCVLISVDSRIHDSSLFSILSGMDQYFPAESVRSVKLGGNTLSWLTLSSRTFDYAFIFAHLDETKLPAAQRICSRVLMLNPRTNVILCMYDDRGLDVYGAGRRALLPLYQKFNSWILDHDRKRISREFAEL